MARLAVFLLVALCVTSAARAGSDDDGKVTGVLIDLVRNVAIDNANAGLAQGGNGPSTLSNIAGARSVKSSGRECQKDNNFVATNFNFSALAIGRFDVFGFNDKPLYNITIAIAVFTSGAVVVPVLVPDAFAGSDLATYVQYLPQAIETAGDIASSVLGLRGKNSDPPPYGAWAGAWAYLLSTINPTITPALGNPDVSSPLGVPRALSGLDVQLALGAIGSIGTVSKAFSPSKVKITYSKTGPAVYLYAQINKPALLASTFLLKPPQPGLGFICGRLYAGGFSTSRVNLPTNLDDALDLPPTTSYVGSIKQPLSFILTKPLPLNLPLKYGFQDIPFGTCNGTFINGTIPTPP